MDIVLIGESKLKISLSGQDVESMSLNINKNGGREAAEALKSKLCILLEKGRLKTGFSPGGGKLFVEIYESGNEGLVLYFTALKSRFGRIKPFIFAFDDSDALCAGASGLHRNYGQRIYGSSLYRCNNEFCLIIYPLDYNDDLSLFFLGEYGKKIGEGEIFASYIEEHGKEIIAEKAIEEISKHFG